MAQENQYAIPHEQRKKSGQAKPRTSITIEGVDDPTNPNFPKVPAPPEQPQLPMDDPYRKLRTQQA